MRASYRTLIRIFQWLLLGLLCLSNRSVEAVPGISRQLSSPADVIAAVNALLQVNGLPPYIPKRALMAAAQSHSEYQTPEATPAPSQVAQPIVAATPMEDGSIVHVVAEGQVLITIAEAYQVSLQDLLTLNNMTTKTVIYPGERLIIRLAQVTPTQTQEPPTATLFPTPTSAPTRTPTPTALPPPESPQPPETSQQGEVEAMPFQTAIASDPLLVIIVVLLIVGIGLVVAGSILRRRP